MRVPEGFWQDIGPGLMWAAVAIGVSHLVQSTRAGAMAGFGLAGVILVALILKYPFFEFGSRYAAATGESLVEGYRRIGPWALWLYFGLTVITAVVHQAALVMFTAFLVQNVLRLALPLVLVAGVLYGSCAALLRIGRFRVFDRTVKLVLALLTVSTLAAAAIALPRVDLSTLALWPPLGGAGDGVSLAFILALVGFMPSAIEVSVMSSLWTLAKAGQVGRRARPASARLDFDIGYLGTGLLAFAFLLLGAALMHGSGQQFSDQGPVFATQLIDLYGATLGAWTRPLVSVAVLTTMLSTVLIVIDGFPRAIERCLQNLGGGALPSLQAQPGGTYWASMIVLGASTLIVLSVFAGTLTAMIDFATIFTFITAPVLGYLNLRAVTSEPVPPTERPGRPLRTLAVVGLVFLVGLGLLYLIELVG